MWTMNFQTFKLDLEKAEESEIKLSTFAESQRKQDNSRKTSASLAMWKILQEMGIPDHLTCLLRICIQVRKQQLELDMEQQTGSK